MHAGQEALRKEWEIVHPEKKNSIVCHKCKKDSGWTNSDLAEIKVTKETSLRCQNCKKYCIHLLTNNTSTNFEEYIITKRNSSTGFRKEEI